MWFFAKYNVHTGSFTVDGQCEIRENSTYKIVLMSNIPMSEIDDIFESIFNSWNGAQFVNKINGRATLLVYNKRTYDLYCMQDFLCGLSPLYYTEKNGIHYFSTSLKKLLLASNIKRQLDKRSVREFVLRHAVYGSKTLLKNVYKLAIQKALHVSTKGLLVLDNEFNPLNDNCQVISTVDECESFWHNYSKNAILRCASSTNKVTMPLSAGYDSNFILWNLAQVYKDNIHCYSVGGVKGVNEIGASKYIAEQYGSTIFSSTMVNPSTFQAFPDIIWRLEGSVYERGIFLQYELAKAISSGGGDIIVCGEGSDEIYSDNFSNVLANPENNQSLFNNRKGNIYTWLTQYISRKGTLLMNSFNIVPRYPYSDVSMLPLIKRIKDVTQTHGKQFHRNFCEKHFSKEVLNMIHSSGGTTDLVSLFEKEPYDALKELKVYAHLQINPFLVMLDTFEIVKLWISKIIKRNNINIKREKQDRYNLQILIHLYIKIFEELFISGRYDDFFNNSSFEFSLDSVLSAALLNKK